jgi:N4-gp56 family major capsid protein
MKQSVQELAAIANATDTASNGVSDVQGSSWLKVVMQAAKRKMYFEQFASVYEVPKGFKDVSIPLATTNKSFTDDTTETSRTYTDLDNVSTVTLTPSDHKYAVAISETVVRTSQVNYIQFAREQLSYDMARDIDSAIATAIVAEGSPAATLYGGDAVSTATLEAGDILTTDLIAKGIRYLRANDWLPEPDSPFVLFIAAPQWEALAKDSQFVNAAEYGSNEVVFNGEVGKYLGVKVIVTESIPSAANWGAGANLAGHRCLLVKAKKAYALAWGMKPRLDSEFDKETASYKIYMDFAYATDSLHGSAIVIINVLDA